MQDPIQHPIIAIDYGDARIGIAASDPLGIMAHPVETIHQSSTNAVARIGEILRLRSARAIVVGLPRRLDGTEGTSAEKVRRFAALLEKTYPLIPLYFIDESFSTMTAAEKLREAGRNAKRQKSVIDQAAAVEILQTWMDLHPVSQ